MATVYIINFAGHDFSDAERYGKLVNITKGYVSFQSLDRVKFELLQGIADSQADDWLLISGTPTLAAIVAAAWIVRHKRIQLLVHDHKNQGKYREMILTEKNFQMIFEVITDAPRSDPSDIRVQ